ncbi:hypothetical protein BH09ACT3_BH09ACT3_09250 [soil metagenome]
MTADQLEPRIREWRTAVLRGGAVDQGDADELEEHLRDQISDLETAGLSGDEAFLIAVGRLGKVDVVTAEFAREHSDRLWKQLAMDRPDDGGRRPAATMLIFAALAATLIQAGRLIAAASGSMETQLFGDPSAPWFLRNLGLFALPMLAGYFAVLRRMSWSRVIGLGVAVAVLALVANLFPFAPGSDTEALVAIHLPIAVWFVAGAAYVGGELRSSARRMDFIRFTGEWAIYYTLIALGGAVLLVLTMFVLSPIEPDFPVEQLITWVLPSGAAAAVVVAAWLVEAKKGIIENLAPVLTAIFTPLFAVMLVLSSIGYLFAGIGRDFDRDLLTVFDLLMLVVLALVVFGISARDSARPAGAMDVLRLVAVVAAIMLDLLVVVSMLTRVGEFGFTPNRVAALGLNIVLLVNLLGTTWQSVRLLTGHAGAVRLERWQTGYLAVFAVWVAAIIVLLPPLFGFE